MNLEEVTFPIYRIRQHHTLVEADSIIYIDTHRGSYILDNKNLQGNFNQRRRCIKEKKPYPLYNPILNHRMLILDKNTTKKYVDSAGRMFSYVKTRYVPLNYYYITEKECIDNIIVLTINSLLCKFIVRNCEENVLARYIGLLLIDGGYMLHNLSEIKKKNTRVKI